MYVLEFYLCMNVQGGSNMTGTNCDLFTHKSSRSYLNHLVFIYGFQGHLVSGSKCLTSNGRMIRCGMKQLFMRGFSFPPLYSTGLHNPGILRDVDL
jgi:hypothetical protein